MCRLVAVLLLVVLIGAACDSGGDDSGGDDSSATTAAASTGQATDTAAASTADTTAEVTEGSESVPTTLASGPAAAADVAGVQAEEVFLPPAAPTISYVPLAEDTSASLDARFRQDVRINDFLTGVAARGVRRDDQLAGVIVAVSVTPEVASDEAFRDAFRAAATQDARVDQQPLVLGPETLVTYEAPSGLRSVLWQYENVFVLISGRDNRQVRDAASVLVHTLVGPLQLENDLDGDGIVERDLDGNGTVDLDVNGDGQPDAIAAAVPSTLAPP